MNCQQVMNLNTLQIHTILYKTKYMYIIIKYKVQGQFISESRSIKTKVHGKPIKSSRSISEISKAYQFKFNKYEV